MQAVSLVARVLCVFALLAATLWALRRFDGQGRRSGTRARRERAVTVLSSTRLGKGAALSVVRIGGAEYVLGVTDAQVTLLATSDAVPDPVPAAVPVAAAPVTAATTSANLARHLTGVRSRAGASTGSAARPRSTPPGTAEFLQAAWQVARGRTLASSALAPDVVQEALAAVTPRTTARPGADGSAPALPIPAARRGTRTDARPAEEQSWSPPAGPQRRPEEAGLLA